MPNPLDTTCGLSHMVYFTLQNSSPENRAKLAEGCIKHLSNHEGVLHFSVGTLSPHYNRPVNDQAYDVA